jgi:hypothetical protein
LLFGVVARDRRVVLHREVDLRDGRTDVRLDVGETPALHVCGHVDVPVRVIVADHGGLRADAHVGDVGEHDVAAARSVENEVLNIGEAVARLVGALDDDREDLLLLEHVAHFDALQHRGGRASHVARFHPGALGGLEVDLDLGGRLQHVLLDDGIHEPIDP